MVVGAGGSNSQPQMGANRDRISANFKMNDCRSRPGRRDLCQFRSPHQVTQIVDSINGTITRTYDGLDRLSSETTPQGSVSYTYDDAGRRSTMTVAGQSAVNYTYDNANRLTQIAQGTATVSIGYDDANRRTSLTLPNGVLVAYGYDAASRVTSITYTQGMTSIGNLTYTYDADGRRTSMGGSLAKVNLPAAITSAIYNANNQLTNWNGTTLSYDLNGNMTYDGATTYTWDARNRLGAFGSTTFAYDAFGRRTRNANGTAFLYDGANAVQELSGLTVTANLLTALGPDEIFTRTDTAGARYFLDDGLGSTLALTDSTGAVQTQYSYEAFGRTTATGASSTSTFQYTGRENDGTGLYFYRARYYNPTIERFISEDPARLRGGIDFYEYVEDNPLSWVDPSGLSLQSTEGYQPSSPGGSGPPLFLYPNGNSWPSSAYYPQDQKCSAPGKLGPMMDSKPCMLSCCQAHDGCYASNLCNASSWGGNLRGYNRPCQQCNSQLIDCLSQAMKSKCPNCK